MSVRKTIPLLLVVLGLLSQLLAACGAPGTSADPAAANGPAATNGAQEPAELVVWAEGGTAQSLENDPGKQGKYARYLIDTFQKEHPGVTVKLEFHGWDEELRQNLTNALLAGTAPDIVVGENYFQQYAELGALVPLDDILGDVKGNLIHGTYKAAEFDGHIYGLPAFTGVFALERNCKLIEEAGLDCDKPPQTWDQFLAQLKTINQKGAGKYYGYTLQGPVGYSVGGIFRMAVYMAQADAPICKDNCTTPWFNNPQTAPVLEFIRQLNKYTPPGLTFNPDEGQVYMQLFKDVSSYQIAGSWHTSWAVQNGCQECRYSAIPTPKGGHQASVVVGNVIYAVLKASKHPQIAKEFVKLMVRDDVQDLVYPALGRLPATRSALTKLRPTADAATQSFIDIYLGDADLGVLPQWRKDPQKLWTIYNNMLTRLLTTDAPVQQLMDDAQHEADAVIKG